MHDVTYLLERFSGDTDSTLGLLFFVSARGALKQFLAFTLEDEYRAKKVRDETRIPAGRYEIKLRAAGGMHTRYKDIYRHHRGMLHLQDVPGFTWIYIHPGNTDDHTSGCILVGDRCRQNVTMSGLLSDSRPAYERIYKEMADLIDKGHRVFIEIEDRDNATN